MDTYNCPYCNAGVYLGDIKEPWFETPCCKKIVHCVDVTEPKYALNSVTTKFMVEHQITGDNSGADDLRKTHKRTTKPRWAHVYSTGYFWFVRIIPPVDLREHGRGHGLALGNQYTTQAEANRFADSVERYFGDAEKALTEPEED